MTDVSIEIITKRKQMLIFLFQDERCSLTAQNFGLITKRKFMFQWSRPTWTNAKSLFALHLTNDFEPV